jgi:transposase
MPALKLRTDYDAVGLRRLASKVDDPDQVRRLLAIAGIYDGLSRQEAGRLAGMDRQILRDWVERFNAGGPEALVNRAAPGNPRRLSADQEAELSRIVEGGPASEGLEHLARWRCADLRALIQQRWGVEYHERTVGKLLRRLGFSHITTRPKHYLQDELAMEAFKKTFRPPVTKSSPRSLQARP